MFRPIARTFEKPHSQNILNFIKAPGMHNKILIIKYRILNMDKVIY